MVGCRMKKLFSIIQVLAILLVLFGCMSQIRPFPEYANGWIGKSIDRLIIATRRPGSFASRIGWKEKQYKLENSNWVYVSPEREGCIVHWEVNPEGIIVGYRTEGERCDI